MAVKKSGWVTINGVHVFIDNKSGKITQGPAKFIGSTLNDLPSSKKSQSDLKAELKAKHEKSSANKKSSKSSPKITAANDYSSSFARELTTQERKDNEKFRSNAKELSKEVFKYDVSKFSDTELAKREKVLNKRLKERTGEKIDGDWRRDFCELNDIQKELKSRSKSSELSKKNENIQSSTKTEKRKKVYKDEDYLDYEGDRDYPIDPDFAPRHSLGLGAGSKKAPSFKPKTGNPAFDNATKTKSKSSTTTKEVSKKTTSPKHTFEEVVNTSYARTSGKYTVKFSDGTSVKMTEKEYNKLYSGKKFEKAVHEKGEALRNLEGKPATADNVAATFDRSIGNTYIGGQTTLKNAFGEKVYDIQRDRSGFYEATIEHSNGYRSAVYGHSAKELSDNINNRQKHYNAPKTSNASTGNSLFDNATNIKSKKTK